MNKTASHNPYLSLMGIPEWQRQAGPDPLLLLQKQAVNCQQCTLATTRNHVVFGVGARHAKLMIIGEAPGFNEDKQGEPFVGRAGQLLNAMLKAVGLAREEVYIANVIKCRPPDNRDPLVAEIRQCSPYLQQQIQLIQPQCILALGRYAGQYLLNSKQSLGEMRALNARYEPDNIPLKVTYHPAYLLRSPKMKAGAYKDLLAIRAMLAND